MYYKNYIPNSQIMLLIVIMYILYISYYDEYVLLFYKLMNDTIYDWYSICIITYYVISLKIVYAEIKI